MQSLDILGPMGIAVIGTLALGGAHVYNKALKPSEPRPTRVTEKLTLAQKQALVDRIGFPLFSSLEPGKLVVTGSTILDVIDGTNHANDIDLFGQLDGCARVAYMLGSKGGNVERVYDHKGYDRVLERYKATQDKHPSVDIVVCSDIDSTVSAFDLSRCKIYYDGVDLVKLDDWNENKTNTVVEGKTATHIYESMSDRGGDRLRKYKARGYGFLDKDGKRVEL